jgi:hypothetical protein
MTRNQLLNMALTTVTEERQDPYGEPEDSFGTIASFWSAYLAARRCGSDLGPFDVAAMMALLKLARIAHSGGTHVDSWIDLAGYAGCGAETAPLKNDPARQEERERAEILRRSLRETLFQSAVPPSN